MKNFKFYVVAYRPRPGWMDAEMDPPWELVNDRGFGFVVYPTLEDAEGYLEMLSYTQTGRKLNIAKTGKFTYVYETCPFFEYKIFECEQSDFFMKEKDKSPWAVGALRKKIDPQELARVQLQKTLSKM